MAYDLAKVTANGNNLIAQILANKSSLSIDKIEISDTQLPSTTDISTMTSVPKVVQTVSANGFSKNSNTLIISTVVDNSSISADYKAWVFGIWGSDSQNGQSQLIAVITSTNSPDTIPAFSGSTPVSYTYKFNIGFSNASKIQFNMIDDSFATNDTVVHTTGDETIDGQKKFKTDPTDSAGNAYAKTVDVNQQLDKKVNIADMRKPASDVAGIEEVNAKQDKIAYTPADDSKVVHDNKDGTISVNGASILPANEDVIERIDGTYTDMNDIPMGWLYLNGWVDLSGLSNWGLPKDFYYVHCFKTGAGPSANIQIAYDVQQNNTYVRTMTSTTWTTWKLLADDSKVAHLSGANNFDTVPTVNNNPLLLASSLPPDLARTGSDQEFIGKNTFDTAPIDKTTGNPYITKDGVPSDVARTGQDANFTAKLQQNGQDVALANNTIARNPNTGSVSETNTFTAQQTFSIAPVINDASTDKGDNQAATMADLKSVENSAWHPVSVSMANFNIENAFYKKDNTKMTYELFVMGTTTTDQNDIDKNGILFQDPEVHNFGKLNDNSIYGQFGLIDAPENCNYGRIVATCSTSANKIYYNNYYSGNGVLPTGSLSFYGYIHIVGTFN